MDDNVYYIIVNDRVYIHAMDRRRDPAVAGSREESQAEISR